MIRSLLLHYRYLLKPGELEHGPARRHATDMNWFPQVYHIRESLVQKNQPVLYWLVDDDGWQWPKKILCEKGINGHSY